MLRRDYDIEKSSLDSAASPSRLSDAAQSPRRSLWSRIIVVLTAGYFIIQLHVTAVIPRIQTWPADSVRDYAEQQHPYGKTPKVALEAHIMSKCPDAQVCLEDLILPTMEQVSNITDFTLSFIGDVDQNGHVKCMHGAEECQGNMVELCVADVYPDPKIFLGFTMCMFKDYHHIPEPELVKNCALEHGIDTDKLDACLLRDEGSYPVTLLKKSIARSKEANVRMSCTVRLENEVRCIRDGGEWKNCDGGSRPKDLVKDIKHRATTLPRVAKHLCASASDSLSRLFGPWA